MRLSGRTAEIVLIAFLCLVHLGITLSVCILGRTGCMNDGCIDYGPLAEH